MVNMKAGIDAAASEAIDVLDRKRKVGEDLIETPAKLRKSLAEQRRNTPSPYVTTKDVSHAKKQTSAVMKPEQNENITPTIVMSQEMFESFMTGTLAFWFLLGHVIWLQYSLHS